jgi:ABC-2 type transport system permease protein
VAYTNTPEREPDLGRIRRYFELYSGFFKASLVGDLEFRLNFVLLILAEFVWYATQLILYEVIYLHTKVMAGWTIEQMRVFMFLALFVDSIYMILWDSNFVKFNDDVRKGSLDLLLTKPINSIFMLTSQKMSISHFPCFFVTGAGLIWAVQQLPDFAWARLAWLLLLIPSGLSVIFCGRFALNATAILFTRADFLQYVWYSLFRLGLRPDGIYAGMLGGTLRYVLIFAIPFAMVASIPARFLFEPVDLNLALWAVIMPFLLVYLLNKYWSFCLRNYTSASS